VDKGEERVIRAESGFAWFIVDRTVDTSHIISSKDSLDFI